jgi:hypothetical protein
MFSMRNRFGIPGVIAVVALVFAMLGGAYAAESDSGSKATASAKGPRGPRGKTGKTGKPGPPGPQGPVGAAGPQGPAGAAGAKGDSGAQGATGATGKTGTVGATGATGKTGTTGTTGPTGDPWVGGGTLPKGETLTGVWSGQLSAAGSETIQISVLLPLKSTPAFVPVGPEEEKEGCPKQADWADPQVPEADEGKLCVYQGVGPGIDNEGSFSGVNEAFGQATKVGGLLVAGCTGLCGWQGVWAVTGN